jgi:ABC-type Fe3+ transport system permease subunit
MISPNSLQHRDSNMSIFASARTWFFLSMIWIGAAVYVGWTQWPRLPLDSSPNDPKTLELYAIAELNHSIFYALLAALGPMVFMVIMKMARRKDKASPGQKT